ncbi:30S ribosomal protein S3 [bacterium]|nr:30S ribosomal protein S3 [bacterium]|tara:strand:+ start:262 stop:987 length:726 start_codon:yes stop_codon:yes gene_type:complete
MTHVAHPYIQRIGINRDWKSRWFTTNPKQFREYLRVDAALRKFFKKRLKGMSVDAIEIERSDKEIRIIIKTAKPGIIIGRSGEGIANLRKEVDLFLRKQKTESKPELKIDVEEVRSPESSARIVGQMIAEGLERRLTFRRVMKQTVEKVMANRDVQGVRVILSGRLGGADMARKEELKKGRIPLQTLRADIDFARVEANLPYGVIGIKVWIYRGDVFGDRTANKQEAPRAARPHRAPRNHK